MNTCARNIALGLALFAGEGLLSTCDQVPASAAISTSGSVPTEAELGARIELLEDRAAARDDAIELLLLHVDAQRECCAGRGVCR